jgi:membrane peptidoglycan carboxypeptidase
LDGQKDDFSLALDARRQPGSSFKPFVLATALREFVSPEATYYLSRNLDFDYEGRGSRLRTMPAYREEGYRSTGPWRV